MREAAQQHYVSGTRFFEEGQWDAALVEFIASFQLSGERDLLHNVSWTHEKAGRTREALDYAERYLAACRGSEDEERATKRVAFLKAKYGQPTPDAKPAAPASPEPAQNATSSPTSPVKLSQSKSVPPAAIGLLAGGGALTLAGVGLLAGAWATGKQAQSPGVTYDEWATLGDRGRALNTGGLSLAIVGGAVVIAGGVWAIVGRKPKTEQPEVAN